MNKAELEQRVKYLEKENEGLKSFAIEIKHFVGVNLIPFRVDIANYEDERNKGILAVLNAVVDIYNKHSRLDKIEPLEPYKCEVIDFKVLKGESNDK